VRIKGFFQRIVNIIWHFCAILDLASAAFYLKYLVETIQNGRRRRAADKKTVSLKRKDAHMGGWRAKLVVLLVVYFAGFATAIYCLAPVPENQASEPPAKGSAHAALKSDEFAQSFNAGMHKCLDFSKDAARRVGVFIKQKLDERNRADG
jgi:hypothetical protein